MKYLYLLIIVFPMFVLLNSCKNPDNPIVVKNLKVTYNWTVDTLLNPYGYGVVPWSIWGSSPSDIWVVGFNLASQGEIFHFDGTKWSRITPDLGFNYEVSDVIGTSPNSVYIVGEELIWDTVLTAKSIILHYTSPTSWQLENIDAGGALLFIHGTSENNLWACGREGTLYHKTQGPWEKMSLGKKLDLGPICAFPDGSVFMMNKYIDYPVMADTNIFYFSKYDNNVWKILDSCRLVNGNDGYKIGYKFGDMALWGASENELYSSGDAFYKYDGLKWVGQGGLGSYKTFIRDIKGSSRNNVYIVADHGNIQHYDGSSWNSIRGFDNYIVNFYSVIPFDNDVFITAFEQGVGFVLHGKITRE